MKKIEKDLILKDLDYANNEYVIKMEKLNAIVSLFMDEEPEISQKSAEEEIKKAEETAENIQKEEEKKQEQSENPSEETQEEIHEEILETEDTSPTLDLPPDVKTLYRKIVMMTHPDKNKTNRNVDVYGDFYRRVVKAKDENDKAEIIYIAYKLKLPEVYDISDEHFGSIRKKIKEKEITSNNVSYNSFWIWYHTDNPQLKQMMVYQINQMMRRK
jgi:uncharacterized protein YdaU (DUF1376 family)